MEVLCAFDNHRCVSVVLDDWPMIEVVTLADVLVKPVVGFLILYVLKGEVEVSYGSTNDYPLAETDMMIFPAGTSIRCHPVQNPSTVILMKIRNRSMLCSKFSRDNIHPDEIPVPVEHKHLKAVPVVRRFMTQLANAVTGRLCCFSFMELKVLELFYYLKAFYSHSQLLPFIQPMTCPDAQFMHFIWNNYRDVRSVKEFAALANYSLSTFKKKFKLTTGLPPKQWLNDQKARGLLHEIRCGEKSLKQISEDYQFTSVSHMGVFCQKNLGLSLMNLRLRVKKGGKGRR
jgi:AraC-like DNA-binding protein